jgi:acetolactate synthase I/II/III large subunit
VVLFLKNIHNALATTSTLMLQALITELDGKVEHNERYLQEVLQARNVSRDALRAALGPYEQFSADLRTSMNYDAILVTDITIFASTWGSGLFPIYGPRHYIHAAGGGIGQGLQMALGTKLGQPEHQVVVMVGDGGLQVNMGELGTAVQEGINVVIVLFNDSG